MAGTKADAEATVAIRTATTFIVIDTSILMYKFLFQNGL
jgi:hypothetical protein